MRYVVRKFHGHSAAGEYRYPDEGEAREARRRFVGYGFRVSLVAQDPSDDWFTFDVYDR